MKFLVTQTVAYFDPDPWGDDVDLFNEKHYLESRLRKCPRRFISLATRWCEIQLGLKLVYLSRKYAGIAVGRYAIWFPVFQRLLKLNKTVLMTDTEWAEIGGGRLNRAAALCSTAVCCNTRVEMERYSRRYRIPIEKFLFVPLAFQRLDIREPTDGGYVFAGGTKDRDWRLLFSAVDSLPYKVKIFTNNKLPPPPPNVEVKFVSREEYYSQMAGASCVVIPIIPGPLAIRGTSSWAPALGMGKVVIVNEPNGAPDYMENGVSGFFMDYDDVNSMRRCIESVMSDPHLRQRVGEAARTRAWKEFSPDAFRRQVLKFLRAKSAENYSSAHLP